MAKCRIQNCFCIYSRRRHRSAGFCAPAGRGVGGRIRGKIAGTARRRYHFAPAGSLAPLALRAIRKGGRVVCGGIHISDIPSFPYQDLWEERSILFRGERPQSNDGDQLVRAVAVGS
jgi:hypothetical protein